MKAIIVDDERNARESLQDKLAQIPSISAIAEFASPLEAFEHVKENPVDVAFLDIEMYEMSGIEMAKRIKDIQPKTNIVFVTGHSEYAGQAISVRCSGYILKPVTTQAILEELFNLRHTVVLSDKGIRVQCFGNFEVFSDGKPLEFSRQKTKELFAYLVVRRGAWCSVKEIAAVIWEDKTDSAGLQSHLRTLSADLTRALESANAKEILLKKRGLMAIDPSKFTCDLYRIIKGELGAINGYAGEFMAQYSWAEFMNAYHDNN